MNRFKWIPFLFLSLAFQFCSDSKSDENDDNFIIDEEEIVEEDSAISFYYGADLSYLNEMLDCGAIYKDEDNILIKDLDWNFLNNNSNNVNIKKR